MATVTWKGYTWDLRDGGASGGPGFGLWAAANVIGPDSNDYLTLKITNPTGVSPVGCEMDCQTVMGYGTYTLVTGSRFDNLDKNIVFGGLFPYDGAAGIEFDVGEISSWDGGGDFGAGVNYVSHNSWYNSYANRTHDSIQMGTSDTHTFILEWSAGKAEYWTYEGVGTGGTLLLHSVHTTSIPVPAAAVPIINLWVYDDGGATSAAASAANDKDAVATNIILRDFTFQAPGSSTSAFDLALSSTVTNGEATTVQLLPPTGKTTADFQAGKLSESSSPMAAIDLTANKYTELEWVLTANSSAVTSTQYEFRVTKNGTALDTYSQTPKWTIGTTPTTFKGQAIIC